MPVESLHRWLKNASIRTKLRWIHLLSTGTALAVISTLLIVHESVEFREQLIQNLQVQARITADNTTAALVFNDSNTVQEILAALRASPDILQAGVYSPDKTLFAAFAADPGRYPPAIWTGSQGVTTTLDGIELAQPILQRGRSLGVLVIQASTHRFHTNVRWHSLVTALAAGVALMVSLLLLSRLHRSITHPLLLLTERIQEIAQRRDYSVRVAYDSADETGVLAAGFNGMLAQIQSWEAALEQELLERKKAEEKLERMAHYDNVTGLTNRHFFHQRFEYAVTGANSFGRRVAVLFIDLDNFKIVNDTLGHAAGDYLLKIVAERLTHCLRGSDMVSRIGGDEFAVILENLAHREESETVAKKILAALEKMVPIDDNEIFIGASIGISLCPDDATHPSTLLRNADTAMYYAKSQGKNTFKSFQPDMEGQALKRLNLESALRRALERKEFLLYYQPQFSLISGKMVGVEALLRWERPDVGIVNPADFIPIAEETGMILPIGNWVLRTACHQAKTWQDAGRPLRVAVNLSGRQFQQDTLVSTVLEIVRETRLDPSLLELEITESSLMDANQSTLDKLEQLREAGIFLSIDDFGTGYSSLSYLKRFPISTLKVDRSFVSELPNNPDDVAIATAIIAMARSLNLEVTAEGVETREQAEFLRGLGCESSQGFYFSHPLAAEKVMELLEQSVVAPPETGSSSSEGPRVL